MSNEIKIEDSTPWHMSSKMFQGKYLQVSCGNAYLLVEKQNGETEIGYQGEETYLPVAYTDDDIADWMTVFTWRSQQTFPWGGKINE